MFSPWRLGSAARLACLQQVAQSRCIAKPSFSGRALALLVGAMQVAWGSVQERVRLDWLFATGRCLFLALWCSS